MDKPYSLTVTDTANHILYDFYDNIYNKHLTFTKNRLLHKYDDIVYFSPNISDTIFVVSDSAVFARYLIKIDYNAMPEIKKNITDTELNVLLEKYFFFNGDFVEMQDYTYINIMTPYSYPPVIYSHKNNKTYLLSVDYTHPLFCFITSAPKAKYGKNCIVLEQPAYKVIAEKDHLYQNAGDYLSSLDLLFNNMNEDDNPVLFFYHLKNWIDNETDKKYYSDYNNDDCNSFVFKCIVAIFMLIPAKTR